MHSFARNALKLSLAGAGVAVLGAGFVGQASAAEAPTAPTAGVPSTDLLNSSVPDTSGVGSQLTDAVPSTSDNTFAIGGKDLTSATPTAATAPSATTPSSDSLPSLSDTKAFQLPTVTDIEAPGLS